MSDTESSFPYAPGPPSEQQGSDLLRFTAFIVAGFIILGTLFILIRAMQENDALTTYEACLNRVEARDNPPGFQPQDFCQRPS